MSVRSNSEHSNRTTLCTISLVFSLFFITVTTPSRLISTVCMFWGVSGGKVSTEAQTKNTTDHCMGGCGSFQGRLMILS